MNAWQHGLYACMPTNMVSWKCIAWITFCTFLHHLFQLLFKGHLSPVKFPAAAALSLEKHEGPMWLHLLFLDCHSWCALSLRNNSISCSSLTLKANFGSQMCSTFCAGTFTEVPCFRQIHGSVLLSNSNMFPSQHGLYACTNMVFCMCCNAWITFSTFLHHLFPQLLKWNLAPIKFPVEAVLSLEKHEGPMWLHYCMVPICGSIQPCYSNHLFLRKAIKSCQWYKILAGYFATLSQPGSNIGVFSIIHEKVLSLAECSFGSSITMSIVEQYLFMVTVWQYYWAMLGLHGEVH